MASGISDTARRPTGHFHLEVRRAGMLIETYNGPNIIVAGSDQIAMALLVGAGSPVGQIGFGSGQAAASPGNAALLTPFTKPVDAASASNGVATFQFSLAGTEANGLTIWEFGLITVAGALYARKVRSSGLAKAADISLSGTWTISFPAGS